MDRDRDPGETGGVRVVTTPRRLDAQQAGKFRDVLRKVVAEGSFHVVADLSETEAMDSSGLGALVSRLSAIREHGGDMRLAACNEFVENLLAITHLDQVFSCYPTVEEAVKSFDSPRDSR